VSGNLFCPLCNAFASDEECPHWDYEHDPRISRKAIARAQAEWKEDQERLERNAVPAWFVEENDAPRRQP
jgi:hypothetical protein